MKNTSTIIWELLRAHGPMTSTQIGIATGLSKNHRGGALNTLHKNGCITKKQDINPLYTGNSKLNAICFVYSVTDKKPLPLIGSRKGGQKTKNIDPQKIACQAFFRPADACAYLGVSRTKLHTLHETDSTFPRKVRMGLRCVGWRKEDIDSWLESKASYL
jgi:prophage regulatory protein